MRTANAVSSGTEPAVGPPAGEGEEHRHRDVDAGHGRDAAEGNALLAEIAEPEHPLRHDGRQRGDPMHALEVIEQRGVGIR